MLITFTATLLITLIILIILMVLAWTRPNVSLKHQWGNGIAYFGVATHFIPLCQNPKWQ
jgi:hypothetical protein